MRFARHYSTRPIYGVPISGILFLSVELITTVLFLGLEYESYWDSLASANEPRDQVYDFIIVGGGVSGSVLANKLSEDFNVLLLEAGGTPNPALNVPILAFLLHGRFPIDWMYRTTPQTHSSFGLEDHVTLWPSGLGLGGSSLINGMIYIRGNPLGFDALGKETGDSEIWSMENALKYFKQIENYNGHFPKNEHGSSGPQPIGKGDLSPFISNYLRAGEEIGYPIRDPNANGPLTEGFAPMDFYLYNTSRRGSTFNSRILPILSRRSLTIKRFSYVHRVLLNDNNEAYGVEYIRRWENLRARARFEVILSAGSIQSAKILLRSGIGPRDHLKEIGITPRIDLPVGQNLQDKYGALVGPFLVNDGQSFVRERDLTIGTWNDWYMRGTGPAASSRAEATFSICSSISKNISKSEGDSKCDPDIHTYVLAASYDDKSDVEMAKSFNFKRRVLKEYFHLANGRDSFLQLVTLARPIGFGNLRLKDNTPQSEILLDPKYLHNDIDMEVLTEAIGIAVKLVEETTSFAEIGGKLLPVHFPGCESHEFKSRKYFECLGRHSTLTAYKYSGTAPMGKNSSKIAVVDSRLRVFGVKNLRVIDGSVFRERIVATNQVSCQVLAEIASDFIKEEYKENNDNYLHNIIPI